MMKKTSIIPLVVIVMIRTVTSQQNVDTAYNLKSYGDNTNGTCSITILKCCELNQFYHVMVNGSSECLNRTDRFHPKVYNIRNENPNDIQEIEGFDIFEQFNVSVEYPKCDPKNSFRVRSITHKVKLLKNGKLLVENVDGAKKIHGLNQYCIDNFVWRNSNDTDINAWICTISEETEPSPYQLNSVCMLISCFFIILTVAVYAWLPELRNLHGLVLSAYLLSFLVGFALMATMQIQLINHNMTTKVCNIFTFIIYFSLLSAFFWLNVMWYDIWRVFSERQSMSTTRSRFLYYSMYSFGTPLFLTTLLAVLALSLNNIKSPFLPNINERCFLHGNTKLIYFYLPIIILCVANLVFFALTVWKIAMTKRRSLRILNRNENNSVKNNKHRFSLYIKLFVLMGINWTLEVISSFQPGYTIFIVTDAYNVLIGLIIFIIFVCKPKTFRMIRGRFKQQTVLLQQSRTKTSAVVLNRTSTSSQLRDEIGMLSVTP